jgi:signal transduction histidine kinase
MLPNSFRARLIVGAAIWIFVALVASGFVLSNLLGEVVVAQIDHDLSDHAEELSSMARIDAKGAALVQVKLSDPRFAVPNSGLYWQIERLSGAATRSPSLGGNNLPLASIPETAERVVVVDTHLGRMRLNQRLLQPPQLNEPIRIGTAVEMRLIDQELAHFNKALALSLAVIAFGLTGAAVVQVAYGLRPLTRIRRALVAVRAGKAERLPDDLPHEVSPLVRDLNSMIAANNDMIRRARTQAGSLAHALKTPLAILMDEGQRMAKAGQSRAAQVIRQQCHLMQRQIDYQMARARAAGRGTPGAVTVVAPAIRTVTSALSRLYQSRGIVFDLTGQEEVAIACDPQDFSEIIGNLADNAAKWARSRVLISTSRSDGSVQVKVEDDGPGIPPESWETVFNLGERLDEEKPGSGLGLAITRELVALYGGQVWIERSELGGTAACLRMPVMQ